MTRIDALWLGVEPVNMRAGADRLLARVVHDGFGVWRAARRLNEGRFIWPREAPAGVTPIVLTQAQFDALMLGLPWQRLEQMKVVSRM